MEPNCCEQSFSGIEKGLEQWHLADIFGISLRGFFSVRKTLVPFLFYIYYLEKADNFKRIRFSQT